MRFIDVLLMCRSTIPKISTTAKWIISAACLSTQPNAQCVCKYVVMHMSLRLTKDAHSSESHSDDRAPNINNQQLIRIPRRNHVP